MQYWKLSACCSIFLLVLVLSLVLVFTNNQPLVLAEQSDKLDKVDVPPPNMLSQSRFPANATCTPLSDDELKEIQSSSNIQFLDLTHIKLTDEALKNLKPLPSLQTISVDGTVVTDKGISFLARHQNLRCIAAQMCSLSFEGFASLRELPKLQTLYLNSSGNPITEKGLAALAALPHLENLHITGCTLPASPRPFALFDKSPINELWLSQPDLSANVIASLRGMPSLKRLYIGGLVMDANKARELSKLSNLIRLELCLNKKLNGEAVKELATMSNLKQLALWRAEISSEDTQYLKSHLRNCRVFGPGEPAQ